MQTIFSESAKFTADGTTKKAWFGPFAKGSIFFSIKPSI